MNKMDYFSALMDIRDHLPEDRRKIFEIRFLAEMKSQEIALALSIFLGIFGIDRFYIGDLGLGTIKFLTLGGFGVWLIIDWFLIMGAARAKNVEIAKKIQFEKQTRESAPEIF